jgi:hypothetical protein
MTSTSCTPQEEVPIDCVLFIDGDLNKYEFITKNWLNKSKKGNSMLFFLQKINSTQSKKVENLSFPSVYKSC